MASKGSVVVARRERQHNRCYKARAPSTRSHSVRDFETMEKKYLLIFALLAVPSSGLPDISLNPRNNLTRNPSELKIFFSIRIQFHELSETFSLFSIVQFPNLECVAGSSSTTKGTCLTTLVFFISSKLYFQTSKHSFLKLGPF